MLNTYYSVQLSKKINSNTLLDVEFRAVVLRSRLVGIGLQNVTHQTLSITEGL